MKEQDVQELLSILLTADKVISEQQLGRLWFPPSHEALQKTFEQGKKRALAAGKKRIDPGVGEDDLLQLTAVSNERVQEVHSATVCIVCSGRQYLNI
jgi:hypothetical protein